MKITKFGTLTLSEDAGPKIEGWEFERQPSDPAEATNEQLLLGFVISWGKKKFDDAVKSAVMEMLRHAAQEKIALAAALRQKGELNEIRGAA